MADKDLIDRLSAHRMVGAAPREELAWLAKRGHLRTLAPGELLIGKDWGQAEELFIVLDGYLSIHVNRGAGRHKVMEWRGGGVTGLLPYSRLVSPPGDVVAEETTEILVVPRGDFPDLLRDCPEITTKLVHLMIDRARLWKSSELHDEKMVSLGKLAAGLAHELNNPASAVARAAKLLPEALATSETASRALGASPLSVAQRAAIDTVREICGASAQDRVLSPLEAVDREDSIAAWLEGHHVDPSLADPLAETAVTLEALDGLARTLDGTALETALRSVSAGCSARRLAIEIEEAASRIFDLVSAVKGFTHMNQATIAGPVDIGQGLAQTLTVLKAKARAKSLSVNVTVEPGLPQVRGFGGELNQVWANLIDNAIDAAQESGRVEISASHKGAQVVVRVVDDGPGIPPDLRDQIFDPFYTTKPVGQGTGLGLDIARRLVRKHDGDMEIDSEPGRTEFRVSLPVAIDGPAGGEP
jgi:signal transduction histidine kinase